MAKLERRGARRGAKPLVAMGGTVSVGWGQDDDGPMFRVAVAPPFGTAGEAYQLSLSRVETAKLVAQLQQRLDDRELKIQEEIAIARREASK